MRRIAVVLCLVVGLLSLSLGASAQTTYTVTLTNDRALSMCSLYAWRDSGTRQDLLEHVLPPSARVEVQLQQGDYLFTAGDCSAPSNPLVRAQPVTVNGDVNWSASISYEESGQTLLRVNNEGLDDICELYLSSSSDVSWGENRLRGPLAFRDATADFPVDEGLYDVLAKDCDGNLFDVQYGIPVHGQTNWVADRWGIPIRLVNGTRATASLLYVSPRGGNWWGYNLLTHVLGPGAAATLYIEPGEYDVALLAAADQTIVEHYDVSLDDEGTYVISAKGVAPGEAPASDFGGLMQLIPVQPDSPPVTNPQKQGEPTLRVINRTANELCMVELRNADAPMEVPPFYYPIQVPVGGTYEASGFPPGSYWFATYGCVDGQPSSSLPYLSPTVAVLGGTVEFTLTEDMAQNRDAIPRGGPSDGGAK